MFTAAGYKIMFKRKHNKCFQIMIPGIGYQNRDVTLCTVRELERNRTIVRPAILHPEDTYNKITGKKIALTKAIESLDRRTRTIIWEAFWEWVESWSIQSDIAKRTPPRIDITAMDDKETKTIRNKR